ncbi:MAG TPA: hypothetical protein VFT59_05820 [Candidatus Saccharimonadales bacterium]|nr:hypothetical protein [Candidatus Saccharimonadales bacterium]
MKPKKMSAANKRFYLVLIAIVVALIGWWGWLQVMPRPLGDKLEYIGKEDYGSWLPLSSARPASVYYYATDMSKEEVREYFRGAKVDEPITPQGGDFLIWAERNNNNFIIRYHTDKTMLNKYAHGRKAVVSVRSEDYNLAKESL